MNQSTPRRWGRPALSAILSICLIVLAGCLANSRSGEAGGSSAQTVEGHSAPPLVFKLAGDSLLASPALDGYYEGQRLNFTTSGNVTAIIVELKDDAPPGLEVHPFLRSAVWKCVFTGTGLLTRTSDQAWCKTDHVGGVPRDGEWTEYEGNRLVVDNADPADHHDGTNGLRPVMVRCQPDYECSWTAWPYAQGTTGPASVNVAWTLYVSVFHDAVPNGYTALAPASA